MSGTCRRRAQPRPHLLQVSRRRRTAPPPSGVLTSVSRVRAGSRAELGPGRGGGLSPRLLPQGSPAHGEPRPSPGAAHRRLQTFSLCFLLQLDEHSASCPEGPVDCSFRGVGCSLQVRPPDRAAGHGPAPCSVPDRCCVPQDKRREVKLHEDAAFGHHSLLVMRSDASLEQQVSSSDQSEQRAQNRSLWA